MSHAGVKPKGDHPMDGPVRRCYCWDIRLPHEHTLDDHDLLDHPTPSSQEKSPS